MPCAQRDALLYDDSAGDVNMKIKKAFCPPQVSNHITASRCFNTSFKEGRPTAFIFHHFMLT
jgi:hypothetical protein